MFEGFKHVRASKLMIDVHCCTMECGVNVVFCFFLSASCRRGFGKTANGSNHSILSPSDSFYACSARKKNRRKKFFDLCQKKSSDSTRKILCVSV